MRNNILRTAVTALVILLSVTPLALCMAEEGTVTTAGLQMPTPVTKETSMAPPDILGMLGLCGFLTADGEPNPFKQTNTQLSISDDFEQISLSGVLQLADALADNRWYLNGDTAIKGNRTLHFGYESETKLLKLAYTEAFGKPVWPDELTPFLASTVPVFPYGQYVAGEPLTLPNRVDTVWLVYDHVSDADLSAYKKLLVESGYLPTTADDGTVEYRNSLLFVSVLFHPESSRVELTVGSYQVFYVALPPWPQPLPELLQRTLPSVAALCRVEVAESGYLCTAEGLSLFELRSFVQSAVRSYGWSALTENNLMTLEEPSVTLEIFSYSAQTEKLIFLLRCEGIDLQTPSPTHSELPTPTVLSDTGFFDDELTDYDFRLTRDSYSESDALEGLRKEFGPLAELADWSEIKALYQDRLGLFLDHLDIQTNEDIWLCYNGHEFTGSRHYFLARIAGTPRQGFLKYDHVGDEAWLGSWQGISLRVLSKVPTGE